ncbi:MAG: SUMF1/EgtB/PvdO family nonheme iron enzyme [Rhodocyclaceae bacterium]
MASESAPATVPSGFLGQHSDDMQRLQRLIERASGFQPIFAACVSSPYHQALMTWIDNNQPDAARLEITPDMDVSALLAQLVEIGQTHRLIHLYGFEAWLKQAGGAPLHAFNYRREKLAEDLPVSLLLWMEPATITTFASEAPDLWAWRAAVFDFATQPALHGPVDEDGSFLARREERERRLKEIRDYLASCTQADPNVAELLLEASGIERGFGRPNEALADALAAQDAFARLNDQRGSALAHGVSSEIKEQVQRNELNHRLGEKHEIHRTLENLKNALELGVIDQETFDTAVTAIAAVSARVAGSGAIAHGPGASAVAVGGVAIHGNSTGDINTGTIIQLATRPGASADDLRRAYLARIYQQANQLPLFSGDGANAQIKLSSVYTALLTRRSRGEDALPHGKPTDKKRPPLSAVKVLDREQHLVLLGGPGSGKTTFSNFLALSMAGELLGLPGPNLASLSAPPADEDGEDQPQAVQWTHGALLPVQVVLRDLASSLPPPGTPVNAETLWQFICEQLKQAALADFAPLLRAELLRDGGLILLDGLDEVPDALDRREQIKQAVQDFALTFKDCRFLVTSRSYAYQRQDWKLAHFAEVELAPFSARQINGFVAAWYEHMVELQRLSPNEGQGRTELLERTIAHNARLAELAAQPLLLTLVARVHTERGGALPERREELYAEAVELLLNKWESLRIRTNSDGSREIEPSLAEYLNAGRDAIRRELDQLAFEAHRDQVGLLGTADIRQEQLFKALHAVAPQRTEINPRLLEAYLRDRAGLLASHGEGLYQFPHRTFQEYLAACHLTVDHFPDELSRLARSDPNRWREAVLLAAAKVARGTPEAVWSLVESLCPDDPPTDGEASAGDLWGALLAAQALCETGLAEPSPQTAARNERKRKRVQRWLLAIVEHGWLPPRDRAIAGQALAMLGDERDLEELIAIEAGEFIMGDDTDDDAGPAHCVRLPAFSIGKYPVTNAQYRRFVAATQRKWRSDAADQANRRNHPATGVDWHDALAYCEWLSAEWRRIGRIGPNDYLTLPSEAEWERAARGCDGRAYPWATEWREDCANTEETGIGETSAVGIFPKGVSEAGCLDMAGNVWEWTRSLWGEDWRKPEFNYPYRPDDPQREVLEAGDDVWRLARGGSWYLDRELARCAFRLRDHPGVRDNGLGLRVVLRSAAV